MNNAVSGKIMENVRKHRDIKLVTTEARMNYFVSESNYHTAEMFLKNLLGMELKNRIFMNKAMYLALSRLELSKNNNNFGIIM